MPTQQDNPEKKSEYRSLTGQKLHQETFYLILQSIRIEEWLQFKAVSKDWYELVFIAITNTVERLPNCFHTLHSVPFDIEPTTQELIFLPEEKDNTVIARKKLSNELILSGDKTALQTFANQYLIEILGWNHADKESCSSLLNILTYLKIKKVFNTTENFIKQAIQLFKDTVRFTTACLEDPILAYLVMDSPLKNNLAPRERQGKITRACNQFGSSLNNRELIGYLCLVYLSEIFQKFLILSALRIFNFLEEGSNSRQTLFLFAPLIDTLSLAFSFYSGLRDARVNIKDIADKYKVEKVGNLNARNFLSGNLHEFFNRSRKPTQESPLVSDKNKAASFSMNFNSDSGH